MHNLQEFGIMCLELINSIINQYQEKFSIRLTLFEGPAVLICSSYAATSSHVATTAYVGVNFASGNPRCTSWVSRRTNDE